MRPDTAFEDTVIRRLRVAQSPDLDPLAARIHFDRVLSPLSLRPRWLAPEAILCIRRMHDPRPGSLRLRTRGLRPPREWEREVLALVDERGRTAARPARGPVPAGAESVLFADRAELLACLARDWLRGQLHQWYWQGLLPEFGQVPPRIVVLAAFRRTPREVPAAMSLLHGAGELPVFLRELDAAIELWSDLVTAFALVRGSPLDRAAAAAAELPGPVHSPIFATPVAPAPSPPIAPPWQAVFDARDASDLPPAAQMLAGVALTIARAPTAVQTQAFAQAAFAWIDSIAAAAPEPAIIPDSAASRSVTEAPENIAPIESPAAPRPPETATPDPAPIAFVETDTAIDDAASTISTPPREAPDPPVQRRDERAADEDVPFHRPAPAPSPESPIAPAQTPPPSPPFDPFAPFFPLPAPVAATIDTRLGGLLYLLNVALFLDLYGDFTQPRAPGIALPPFDFVTLIGRALLDGDDGIDDDPIWPLLARLAGRDPADPPGRDFAPPDRWQLPTAWLKPFPGDAAWTFISSDERFRVRHPAGFAVFDLPWEVTRGDLPAPLLRWVDWITPYVRARLGRAMGWDLHGDPVRRLFGATARVRATSTRVDVFLSLAELPIEVRFAGLDRDPGWVPAAGRTIAFHFE